MTSFWRLIRETGQSLTMSAGVTALILGVISLGVAVPLAVSAPLVLGVGLVVAGITAFMVYREMKQAKQKEAEHEQEMQQMHESDTQMINSIRRVEENVLDLKSKAQTSQVSGLAQEKSKPISQPSQASLIHHTLSRKPSSNNQPAPVQSFSTPHMKSRVVEFQENAALLNQKQEQKKQEKATKRSNSKSFSFFNFFRNAFKRKPANDMHFADASPKRSRIG